MGVGIFREGVALLGPDVETNGCRADCNFGNSCGADVLYKRAARP